MPLTVSVTAVRLRHVRAADYSARRPSKDRTRPHGGGSMLRRVLVALAFCAVLPATALAQIQEGIGPRVGFSVDPDQLVLGGQMIVGEIAPKLTFDPSLELGFGDDVTTFAANFDLHYHFDIENVTWQPYAGFGLD